MEVFDWLMAVRPQRVVSRSSTKGNGVQSAMTYGVFRMLELSVGNSASLMPRGQYRQQITSRLVKVRFSSTMLNALEVKTSCQIALTEDGI